jgi:hypothetical protein
MYMTKYIIKGVNNNDNKNPPQKPNLLLLAMTAIIRLATMYMARNCGLANILKIIS